jgi:hypothetical protein
LKSADVLWLTVDGADLVKSRQQVLHRTQLLFQRIKPFLESQAPKIIVVISHLDRGEPEERSIKVLESEAMRHGLELSIINVASFSDEQTIEPGTGLLDLLKATFDIGASSRAAFWPDIERTPVGRYILRFRSDLRSSR